jgi:hypothetical protein
MSRKVYPKLSGSSFTTFEDCVQYAKRQKISGWIFEQTDGYHAGYHLIVDYFEHYYSLPNYILHATVTITVNIIESNPS